MAKAYKSSHSRWYVAGECSWVLVKFIKMGDGISPELQAADRELDQGGPAENMATGVASSHGHLSA